MFAEMWVECSRNYIPHSNHLRSLEKNLCKAVRILFLKYQILAKFAELDNILC